MQERLRADEHLGSEMKARFPFLDDSRRLILVTGHRRENHDGGIARVCGALSEISRRGDAQILYPVHLNPTVKREVDSVLRGVEHVHLIEPQPYLPFV